MDVQMDKPTDMNKALVSSTLGLGSNLLIVASPGSVSSSVGDLG